MVSIIRHAYLENSIFWQVVKTEPVCADKYNSPSKKLSDFLKIVVYQL